MTTSYSDVLKADGKTEPYEQSEVATVGVVFNAGGHLELSWEGAKRYEELSGKPFQSNTPRHCKYLHTMIKELGSNAFIFNYGIKHPLHRPVYVVHIPWSMREHYKIDYDEDWMSESIFLQHSKKIFDEAGELALNHLLDKDYRLSKIAEILSRDRPGDEVVNPIYPVAPFGKNTERYG
jgi:hypothetical protein